jgi:hypothetical protein
MNKQSKKPRQGIRRSAEHTCSYCLYFQPHLPNRRPLRGNCSHHKQWIEHASLTTCSDMSRKKLLPRGIYELVSISKAGWEYVRREIPQRTRLFLVKGKEGEMRENGCAGKADSS